MHTFAACLFGNFTAQGRQAEWRGTPVRHSLYGVWKNVCQLKVAETAWDLWEIYLDLWPNQRSEFEFQLQTTQSRVVFRTHARIKVGPRAVATHEPFAQKKTKSGQKCDIFWEPVEQFLQICWDYESTRNDCKYLKARAKGAQKCDQKPRSREARHKPRSREAAKYDTSREAETAEKPRSPHKPRSREAEKREPDKPRSREAEEPPGKPRSREAEKPPGKPRSREATGQAEKPRSHRTSWDSSPGTPSEHYVASSPSQDINSPTPSEQYVAPWDISPATPFEYMLHLRRSSQRPPLNTTSPR